MACGDPQITCIDNNQYSIQIPKCHIEKWLKRVKKYTPLEKNSNIQYNLFQNDILKYPTDYSHSENDYNTLVTNPNYVTINCFGASSSKRKEVARAFKFEKYSQASNHHTKFRFIYLFKFIEYNCFYKKHMDFLESVNLVDFIYLFIFLNVVYWFKACEYFCEYFADLDWANGW